MTNEELLKQLKELSETTGLAINEDNNEYNELLAQKEVLEREISELQIKLSDDSNYPVFSFLSSKATIDRATKMVEQLNLELERNQNNILADSNRIQEIEKEISVYNELISNDEKELEELGRKLRSLGENPSLEESKEIDAEIAAIQEDKDLLKSDLALLMTSKEGLSSSVSSMNERNKDIASLVERYEQVKSSASSRTTEEVNKSKKSADENKLSKLQGGLAQIDSRLSYIETNVTEDVDILVDEIEAGVIDANDIIPRLNEIKSKMPSVLENADERRTEIESEKALLSGQISDLQTKLSDSINYTPSVFATEVINEEIDAIEGRIAQTEEAIKDYEYDINKRESYINRLNSDIEVRKEQIDALSLENNELRYRNTSADLSKEDSMAIAKQIESNKRKIKRIEVNIERCEKLIVNLEQENSLAKKNKKSYENLKLSEAKDLENQKQDLEDKKTINKFEMTNDEALLAVLMGQMAALNAEEALLDGTMIAKLDNLIANYVPVKLEAIEEIETPVIETDEAIMNAIDDSQEVVETPTVEEVIETTAEIVEDEVTPDVLTAGATVVNPEEVEQIMNESNSNNDERIFFDESRIQEGYEYLNAQNALNLGKTEETEVAKTEETKNLPIPIVTIKEASLDLIEKVRNATFISNLKGKLSAVGIVIGILGGAAVASSMNNIEELPTITVDSLDEDLDDKLVLNDNGNEQPEFEYSDPIVEETVETPVVEETVETPVVEETVDTPVVEETVETPVVQETVETPVVQETVETPVVQETIETPVVEEKYESPVVQETIDAPVVEPIDVTLSEGQTLVVPTNDGNMIAVDNSDMQNDNIINQTLGYDVNYVYPTDDGYEAPETQLIGEDYVIEDVKTNDNNTVTVTVNEPEVSKPSIADDYYNPNLSAEEQAFLDALLQEQLEAQQSLDKGMSR